MISQPQTIPQLGDCTVWITANIREKVQFGLLQMISQLTAPRTVQFGLLQIVEKKFRI